MNLIFRLLITWRDEIIRSPFISKVKFKYWRFCWSKYTTEHDQNKLGDHALILFFQPFCGKWFQTIGAFLGSGAVSGKILEQLIIEAVILLKNQNMHVTKYAIL